MEQESKAGLLQQLIGRKVEIYCGETNAITGTITNVVGELAHLKSVNGLMIYVIIAKINAIAEVKESETLQNLIDQVNG
ncbi:MAG: hypothetical protein H7Z37_04720 [Pyrinomonadaceae bacterium]|nr:hypothetical protein [Pyrinomonadaceae bacterium]